MKKYTIFGILLLSAFLVAGGLVTYYGQSTHDIEVTLPVNFIGDAEYFISGFAGQVITGNTLGMENVADFEVLMQISDDTPEGIETSYKGELTLVQKVVDFESDVWEILPEGNTAVVEYTVSGDTFTAEVVEGALEGYVLIYYKDNSDRFENPAQGILISEVSGNLPYESDGNADEYNYCETDEYVTCHGAKLWYVPETAIESGNIDWNQASNFLFETKLIQYNSNGEVVIYPGETLEFTPEFDVSPLFEGETSITTSVAPTD